MQDASRGETKHIDSAHPLVRALETQHDMPGDSTQSRAVLGALIPDALADAHAAVEAPATAIRDAALSRTDPSVAESTNTRPVCAAPTPCPDPCSSHTIPGMRRHIRTGRWLVSGFLLTLMLGSAQTTHGANSARTDAYHATAADAAPISDPQPASNILPPGTRSVDLSVRSSANTSCGYAVGADKPYAQMTPFAQGAGSATHRTTIAISPEPALVNDVYVRCATQPEFVLALKYRARTNANPSFPRTGMLWGWFQWRGDATISFDDLAKVDLWMGADAWDAAAVPRLASDFKRIRERNPDTLFLASVNAVEPYANNVPDDYFLRDVNGNKFEVWPGAYRLNLTRPEVAEFQARYTYERIEQAGFIHDGVFIDNVFLTQSHHKADIHGKPFQVDANGDGVVDDPAQFDAAWRAGVLREIALVREYLPHAILSGHAMDIREPRIAEAFNGISFGFAAANVIEGEQSFANVYDEYARWMTDAREPRVVMHEGSPIDLFAYGYDYEPLKKVSPSGGAFARDFYPWMRFAFGLTQMQDGYYAYEWGDTWHGNVWWYDEYDFELGRPLGPARHVFATGNSTPNLIDNGGFEAPLAGAWSTYVDTSSGYAASVALDTRVYKSGTAAARIDVAQSGGDDWRVDFYQPNRALAANGRYVLSFWAKADRARPLSVNSAKGAPDWDNYGLYRTVSLDTDWREYNVAFDAPTTAVTDARIQFMAGALTGTIWIDDIRLTSRPPDVMRRDFSSGVVLLNGADSVQTVALEPGLSRFNGAQAPRLQRIHDDGDGRAPLQINSGAWQTASISSGEWKSSGPFFHAFGYSAHKLTAGAGAVSWPVAIDQTDTYTVSVWYPAAPDAATWTANASYALIVNGTMILSKTLDQRTQGDAWHVIGSAHIPAGARVAVRLTCTAMCVADAVYVASASRYNDGAAVRSITLQPFDAIVLRRDARGTRAYYLPVTTR